MSTKTKRTPDPLEFAEAVVFATTGMPTEEMCELARSTAVETLAEALLAVAMERRDPLPRFMRLLCRALTVAAVAGFNTERELSLPDRPDTDVEIAGIQPKMGLA